MDTTPILRPSATAVSLPLGLAAPASGLAESNGDFAGIFRQLWSFAQRPETGSSERRAVTAPEDLETRGDAAAAEHADPAKVIPADAGLDTERQASVVEPPERSGRAPGRAPPPGRFETVGREDGWTQEEKAPIGVPTAEISSRMLGPEQQDIAAPIQAAEEAEAQAKAQAKAPLAPIIAAGQQRSLGQNRAVLQMLSLASQRPAPPDPQPSIKSAPARTARSEAAMTVDLHANGDRLSAPPARPGAALADQREPPPAWASSSVPPDRGAAPAQPGVPLIAPFSLQQGEGGLHLAQGSPRRGFPSAWAAGDPDRPLAKTSARGSWTQFSPPVPEASRPGPGMTQPRLAERAQSVQPVEVAPPAQSAELLAKRKPADASPIPRAAQEAGPAAPSITPVAAARPDKAATLAARTIALQGRHERQIAQPGELLNPEHSIAGPAPTQTGQTPPPKGNQPLPPVTQVGSPGQTRAGANGLARLDQPGGERGDAAPLRLDISGLANPTGGDPQLQKSEAGRVPTAQLVDHLLRQPERAVEISLHPRELGRVHMALAVSEHGMTLTITADRPETLDLMRRHIDQLAQEFRQLGQNEVGFAFRQGDADRQPGQDQDAVAGPLAGDAKEVAEPLHTGPVVHTGLDLRL